MARGFGESTRSAIFRHTRCPSTRTSSAMFADATTNRPLTLRSPTSWKKRSCGTSSSSATSGDALAEHEGDSGRHDQRERAEHHPRAAGVGALGLVADLLAQVVVDPAQFALGGRLVE